VRDCKHGSLKRKCERCDDEREIAALRAAVEKAEEGRRQITTPLHGVIAGLVTRCDAAEAKLEKAEEERDEWKKESTLLTHKIITCGVAASHPDAALSRRADSYGGKWDSPQAEKVRELRTRADAAVARVKTLTKENERLRRERRKAAAALKEKP
jgi:hypothetical protein